MDLPRFMRRREVRTMLGLSDESLTKLIRAGELVPRRFTAKARAVFVEAEVLALANRVASTTKGGR